MQYTITLKDLADTIILLVAVVSFLFIYNAKMKKSVNKDDMDELKKYVDGQNKVLSDRCGVIEGKITTDIKGVHEKLDKLLFLMIEQK